MDLEVVGRHALLFDDDTMAAFVNSADALVDWHSLQIDRYDVRHLLSVPPPSRRRNRNSESILSDDPALQSQLDYERYLDLLLHPDDQEVEEDEKPLDTGGYRAVAFSYGNSDDSADQKNTAAGMESSGFLPPFPIPRDLSQSLPPTEKIHQIIARTAKFVIEHGGQSEIVLRVKQGDNPIFGFLMPDHHLHPYFRFLVEHPDLLDSGGDVRSQDEDKENEKGVGGALSLLGSVYGSGEEEDNDDIAKTEKDVSKDGMGVSDDTVSHGSKNMESMAGFSKDELVSRNPILANKEKVLAVKKNSSVIASKSGSVKGNKKEDKSAVSSAASGKAKSSAREVSRTTEPLILEPPLQVKRLINKLVEFVVRNGKQFEETLIEQDGKDGKFSFLLPSNQYHTYYLKVLQTAQESKYYGRSSTSGKQNEYSSLPSAPCDIPLESDRKEKFKMVIGKSKKEAQEIESKGTKHESGITVTVDASAAAAILQAATRGIKNSYAPMIPTAFPSAQGHVSSSIGDQTGNSGSTVGSSNQNGSLNASAIAPKTSETPLSEEQKLKAERLKRAKMFVAMLKSGAVPFKTGTSCSSSMEPLESGSEVNLTGKEIEESSALVNVERPATVENSQKNYFDERSELLSKRKYRSRSGKFEDDEYDDENDNRRRKYRSRSKGGESDDEHEDAEATEQKHYRKRHRSYSSSEESKDKGESNEEEQDHKHHKSRHRSRHSQQKDDEYEDKHHRRSRKKHRSHHSKRGLKRHSDEEDEPDNEERDHKDSRKKHHSHHRSSHHSRDRHRHRKGRSSGENQSRRHRKHPSSSSDDEDENHNILDKHTKVLHEEKNHLEEGEISSRASQESRDIASGHFSREASVDNGTSRASSQPPGGSAEVPNDLRAKVRAMLIATRL